MFLGLTLALTGCDSVPSISERFSPVPPQTRVLAVDHRTAFYAAQRALKGIDFVVTKAALAQGLLEGRSEIRHNQAFGEVRQYSFAIQLNDVDDKHTEVAVLLHEQVQGELGVGATDQALRTHGLYDSYFEMLDQGVRDELASPEPGR
jgi:hypothetical protein